MSAIELPPGPVGTKEAPVSQMKRSFELPGIRERQEIALELYPEASPKMAENPLASSVTKFNRGAYRGTTPGNKGKATQEKAESFGFWATKRNTVGFRAKAAALLAVKNIMTASTNRRKQKHQDRYNNRLDVLLCLLSVLSIFLTILEEETRWEYGNQFEHGLFDKTFNIHYRGSLWSYDILIPGNVLALCFVVCWKYMTRLKERQVQWNFDSKLAAGCFDNMWLRWLVELSIALIMPVPRWTISLVENPEEVFFQDDRPTHITGWTRHLGLLCFVRLYTVLRVARNLTPVYKKR